MAKVIDFDTWNIPIDDVLSLNGRIVNCFLHANIHTIEQLIDRSEAELLNIPQFGQSSLDTVKRELAQYQLTLKGSKARVDGLTYYPKEPLLVIYERAFAEGRKVGFAEGVEVCQDSIERAQSIVAATEKEIKLINLVPIKDRRVEELDVSPRTLNNLKRDDINTIGQLAEYSEERLMQIQGLGETGLQQVVQALLGYDLSLKEDAPKSREDLIPYLENGTEHSITAPPFHGIDMSNRAYNLLIRAGIDTLEKLTDRTADDLLKIPWFGPATLESVIQALDRRGFSLHYEGSPFLRSFEE